MSAPRSKQEAEAVEREVVRMRSPFGRAADDVMKLTAWAFEGDDDSLTDVEIRRQER